MRNGFAQNITELATHDPRIVLLSGDIGNRLFDEFKKTAATAILQLWGSRSQYDGRCCWHGTLRHAPFCLYNYSLHNSKVL